MTEPTKIRELQDVILDLTAERSALQTRLELIARNAESWHHDDEAKQRALNVIASWARGGELPASLVADLEGRNDGS